MTATDPTADRHAEIWDLLPWYANDTLSGADRGRVESHLRSCSECERELFFLSGLSASIGDEEALLVSPERSLTAVNERIDALEAARRGSLGWTDIARMVGAKLGGAAAVGAWRPAWAALAVLLLAALAWLGLGLSAPEFRTLSSPSELHATDGGAIRLVFAADATVADLQALLNRLDVVVVTGPSTYGVYTARLRDRSDAARLERVVAELRQSWLVTFAEPIAEPVAGGGGS